MSVPTFQFTRDASDRLTFELPELPASEYPTVRDQIISKFHLVQISPTISGLDEIFATFLQLRGFHRIGIEWDIWSGFTVVAKSKRAETLVRNIGQYWQEQMSATSNA